MDDFRFNHNFLSTQLSQRSQRPPLIQQDIQPWNQSSISKSRLYSKKQERSTIVALARQRKQSVQERIQQMYKKHSRKEARNGHKDKPTNSRQIYRQKLKELQQGQEFRQLGKKQGELNEIPEGELQLLRLNNYSKYHYLGNEPMMKNKDERTSSDYKCTRNFQRMLKIKDKIRRKHVQAISKDKQLYQTVNINHSRTQREPSFSELTAKATLERNKLKIKMRGISKEKMKSLDEVESKMEVRGVCSNAFQYCAEKQDFRMTWGAWRGRIP